MARVVLVEPDVSEGLLHAWHLVPSTLEGVQSVDGDQDLRVKLGAMDSLHWKIMAAVVCMLQAVRTVENMRRKSGVGR